MPLEPYRITDDDRHFLSEMSINALALYEKEGSVMAIRTVGVLGDRRAEAATERMIGGRIFTFVTRQNTP